MTHDQLSDIIIETVDHRSLANVMASIYLEFYGEPLDADAVESEWAINPDKEWDADMLDAIALTMRINLGLDSLETKEVAQ